MERGGAPGFSRFTVIWNQLEGNWTQSKDKVTGASALFRTSLYVIRIFVNRILVFMHRGTSLSQRCDTLANWMSFVPVRDTLDPGICQSR